MDTSPPEDKASPSETDLRRNFRTLEQVDSGGTSTPRPSAYDAARNALDSRAVGSGTGKNGKTVNPESIPYTPADSLESKEEHKPDTAAADSRMLRENRYAEENMASPADRLKSLEKAIQLQKAKIQGFSDAYQYDNAEREQKTLDLLEKQYAAENRRDLDRFIAEWTEEIDRQRQEQREQEILDLYNLYVPLPQETVASREEEGYTGNGETSSGSDGTYSLADVSLWESPDYQTARDGQTKGTDSGRAEEYLAESLRQVILGNYTDDVTLLGTALQIGMSLTGADTAMDIRDLAYDLTHWKWDKGHIAQTVLDAVGLIPGIGVVKNLDEAGTVLKALFNGAETLTPALAAAAKISPEASEWLMKGIAKYGDTVTDLLHGAAKNADDAAEWGLLVSAVRKAEESADILKSAARNADEALDAAQSAAKSADELIEGTGNVVTAKSFKLTPTHSKMLSNKEFSALMDNIKVNGIQESIKYIKYNGNMYVVDGHHRLLAAKKLGITEVPIEEVKLPYKSYGTFEDLFWGN